MVVMVVMVMGFCLLYTHTGIDDGAAISVAPAIR